MTRTILETFDGQCFFCRETVLIDTSSLKYEEALTHQDLDFSKPSSLSLSVYSLHCLSNLTKLDKRKVFSQGVGIPPKLLDKVVQSTLKVELCLICSRLNEQFNCLFEQLEKIKLEVNHCLKNIHDKFKEGENYRKYNDINGKKFRSQLKLTELNLSKEEELLCLVDNQGETLTKLRSEIKEKCSAKLAISSPKVLLEVQKLSPKQNLIKPVENPPIKSAEAENFIDQLTPNKKRSKLINFDSFLDSKVPAQANFQTCPEVIQLTDEEEENHETPPCLDIDIDVSEVFQVKVDVNVNDLLQYEENSDETSFSPGFINEPSPLAPAEPEPDFYPADPVPPPIKVYEEDPAKGNHPSSRLTLTLNSSSIKPQMVKDPSTGKFKCLLCSKTFLCLSAVSLHHKAKHLKLRLKCGYPHCDKHFSQKCTYRIHYQSVHLGLKLTCQICRKQFSDNSNLSKHMRRVHFIGGEKKFKCSVCSQNFTQRQYLKRHFKKYHQDCDPLNIY